MKQSLPTIGITMGDPVGIGPEICAKALTPDVYEYCNPILFGDTHLLESAVNAFSPGTRVRPVKSVNDALFTHGTIDLIPVSDLTPGCVRPGHPTAETGKAMINYITTAVEKAVQNDIQGIATGPINKVAMKLAGSRFHGHTELIASMTETDRYVMMLTGETLSVVLVTIHIPFKTITDELTSEKIIDTIRITGESLKSRFGIAAPRIAVAALNPHAGEDGLFGNEEREIILPAIRSAASEGYDISGPIPPDTVFYHAANGRFDVVICMYHDQGLIPFKMIHFSDGVNTTLGLPIIRTSVDHGTAYDIAGNGLADPGSLVSAVKLAAKQASVSALW